ncbi:STM3941 family protein [Nocardioides aurantiacus]|uniref:PH (Pleckstrin Homology) domain-containing protein n=1 Tax=Nocardioides aurantiacus TaxID=86796 RepID=A0A3N2CYH5_9ACTN|nr:STM3941 family protein [Nocardioides aurantiacus]ROR92244.1 hypothetical protein EDD33_3131 [Nocardioides aurantiacus]
MSGPHLRASEQPEPLLVRSPLGQDLVAAVVGLATAAGLVWLVAGGWLTATGSPRAGAGVVAAVVAAALAGPAGAWFLVRALLRLPLLRVDERGITTTWTWDATGLVPWEEVTRIRLGSEHVVVRVRDPEAVLRRVPSHRRGSLRLRQRRHGSPVTLQLGPLRPRVSQTVALLHHWRSHAAWARRSRSG